ncbi:MAG: hypothetical protein A3D53_03615 [Candidatus Magasanikbacteria bacterium RIFCSPHIGHO2_02_FULL_45_10]|uniref:Flavoprotein n=1 Tax=Candidatus Magasanikbacteria bacterium RIFCSPHIGHO2_02_FULL_45_10 TaxID=1798679 RepID=A0A1F6MA00_9BACT|nr:MAG: hypothetical protein A3D53_03615 [Candidatus Magasanikbacteria bacterium RIFCSPHIGHO2_02_FULL_45_10]
MRIAIIGGGAAGLMAAATINEVDPTADVFLLEKNPELGKKVIISGGGRCNVTTGIESASEVLAKYPRGGKFLQSTLRHFTPTDVRAWFEAHDVPLKCEDDVRVFPVSDNGHDIVGAFTLLFSSSKTKVLLKHGVSGLSKTDRGFMVEVKNQPPLPADRVVLALGGQAYRHTGSTGDGYALAEKLGHHITHLAASLNSFITAEKWPRSLAGVSFTKATISAHGTKHYSFTGPFLFTHSGVSGPAVFALSSLVAYEEYGPKKALKINIDLVPDSAADKLFADLKSLMIQSTKKSFKNTLRTLVPLSVTDVICSELQISPTIKNSETSHQMARAAVDWIKNVPLAVIGRGTGDEFVTAGGVELSEVDPRTMESKLCQGLYFAGEILNVDGFTGGFNLQASWSTGRMAGKSASK